MCDPFQFAILNFIIKNLLFNLKQNLKIFYKKYSLIIYSQKGSLHQQKQCKLIVIISNQNCPELWRISEVRCFLNKRKKSATSYSRFTISTSMFQKRYATTFKLKQKDFYKIVKNDQQSRQRREVWRNYRPRLPYFCCPRVLSLDICQ